MTNYRFKADIREPRIVRDRTVYHYNFKARTDRFDPERAKPYCPPVRQDGTAVIVTDWYGVERRFESATEGLAYAASMYANPPRPAKQKQETARWARTYKPLTWHAQRANNYSRGAASKGKRVTHRGPVE